jgi:hypothetical protein
MVPDRVCVPIVPVRVLASRVKFFHDHVRLAVAVTTPQRLSS